MIKPEYIGDGLYVCQGSWSKEIVVYIKDVLRDKRVKIFLEEVHVDKLKEYFERIKADQGST